MRVLFDEQIFSQQRFGGISRYFTELAKALGGQDDVTARLLSPLSNNHYAKQVPRPLRVGISCPVIAGTESFIWHFNRKISNHYVRRFRPDVLHQTYYHVNNLQNHPGVRIVTTVHDMIHELFPEQFPDPEMVASLKLQAVKTADLVICVSENTQKDLVEITGIDQSKTRVVHHGIDHIKPSELPVDRPHGKPYLLYVGLRHIYKNYHRVLKAYVKCPGLMKQYDLVCFGSGALTASETDLMSQLNIPVDNVVVTSGNDSVLSGYYQHADAFLYPSLYEGFGFPPLEAMMHGCPVISSNVSSLPEVLGTAAEYFDPQDTDELVSAIETVLNSQNRSDELADLGYTQARRFTWEKCADKTLTSYRKLV